MRDWLANVQLGMSVQFKKRSAVNRKSRKAEDGDDDEADDTVIIRPNIGEQSSSIVTSSSMKKSDVDRDTEAAGTIVTTVFESSQEVVPQRNAGDATATCDIDGNTKPASTVSNKYAPVKAPTFVRVNSSRNI